MLMAISPRVQGSVVSRPQVEPRYEVPLHVVRRVCASAKTLRCISLHKRSYFQILKVGCEHGRSNGSQLTPSSVTKCNGSQQCGEMGVSLNNLTSYLFSKLATLIKLHVACKLENKWTSLTG